MATRLLHSSEDSDFFFRNPISLELAKNKGTPVTGAVSA
jgi:hypothetical protein